MFIKHTYKFKKDNVIGYACNTDIIPEGEILEDIEILNPEDGMLLKNILTNDINTIVVLKEGDTIENYEEVGDEDYE